MTLRALLSLRPVRGLLTRGPGDQGLALAQQRVTFVATGWCALASSAMSDFDVFLADCPARTTLALVGDTWSVVVIVALGERPRRYSELLERIGGISKKMLTQTLNKLERNGLIEREAPGYALTDLGASLLGVVGALAGWAEKHTDALLDAQSSVA